MRWMKSVAAAGNNNNYIENAGESENSMTRNWRENQFFHDAVVEREALEKLIHWEYLPIKFGTNKKIFSFSTASAIFLRFFSNRIFGVDALFSRL